MIGQFDPLQLVELERPRGCLIAAIRAVVIEEFNLPCGFDFKIPDRRNRIAFAREIAMYLTRELTAWSWGRIGQSFARDHSTVIHAHKLVARRMQGNSPFTTTIERMKKAVTGCPL